MYYWFPELGKYVIHILSSKINFQTSKSLTNSRKSWKIRKLMKWQVKLFIPLLLLSKRFRFFSCWRNETKLLISSESIGPQFVIIHQFTSKLTKTQRGGLTAKLSSVRWMITIHHFKSWSCHNSFSNISIFVSKLIITH